MFVYHTSTDMAILLLYVDDIILTASSLALLDRLLYLLKSEISMNDLDPLPYFLGIHVHQHDIGLFFFFVSIKVYMLMSYFKVQL